MLKWAVIYFFSLLMIVGIINGICQFVSTFHVNLELNVIAIEYVTLMFCLLPYAVYKVYLVIKNK